MPDRPDVPPPDIDDGDPGLARERTELAWLRTAISFSAVGAAVLRWHVVVAAALLLIGGLIWLVGRGAVSGRGRTPRQPGDGWLPAGRPHLWVVTLATTLVALTAVAITVLAPGPGW